jgi:hypothetical protein
MGRKKMIDKITMLLLPVYVISTLLFSIKIFHGEGSLFNYFIVIIHGYCALYSASLWYDEIKD